MFFRVLVNFAQTSIDTDKQVLVYCFGWLNLKNIKGVTGIGYHLSVSMAIFFNYQFSFGSIIISSIVHGQLATLLG